MCSALIGAGPSPEKSAIRPSSDDLSAARSATYADMPERSTTVEPSSTLSADLYLYETVGAAPVLPVVISTMSYVRYQRLIASCIAVRPTSSSP